MLDPVFQGKSFAAQYTSAAKISELYAQTLIDESGIAEFHHRPLIVLDNACGTGSVASVLSRTLNEQNRTSWQLTCGDLAGGMVEYTQHRMKTEGWHNAEAKIMNAQETGLPSAHYTHAFTAFAFNMFPDPKGALKECHRVLQPGGTLATSTWKHANWCTIMTPVVKTLQADLPYPTMEKINAMLNKGWDSESHVRAYFEQAGFKDVDISTVEKECTLPIQEFSEACKILLPYVLSRFWTQWQRDQYAAQLPETLLQYLKEEYGKDGLVPMKGVAIVAVGRKA
ncbi:methyltransferase tpcH [Aspergillus homomorphus CBS 101889]|uniref:S-adenosyl-L-methionine-dependent methyltransferase n=1 Tax=Aspergillus homomorphus (strain CBS 101889) TaxID=1450537 RepID=A0A395HX60_ASPHC|nr:S-adenosyl-L-methionine-dependent methyltransferase [Aspergillus homomorphus CBS 101889]RAL12380.1 S-adenosyl-L-methionine-dependent methyltransferase [Aspergillus homomorphus CBS 101889]